MFTTGATTVKGRTLRRTGWAAMTVDDDRPPFSFVTVEGPVTISDDLADGARMGRACSAVATWAPTAPRSTASATACPASS